MRTRPANHPPAATLRAAICLVFMLGVWLALMTLRDFAESPAPLIRQS